MLKKHSVPVWPQPQEITFGEGALQLSSPLSLETKGEAPWLSAAAQQVAEVLGAKSRGGEEAKRRTSTGKGGFGLTVMTMEALPRGLKRVEEEEGYVLSVTPKGVVLAGKDARGVFYGAQTLAQLVGNSGTATELPSKSATAELSVGQFGSCPQIALPLVTVRDWPRFSVRGAHVYMPSRQHMDFFWRFLDFLAGYKCNTLILEVGGGMEYTKHPEINEAWVKFCQDVLNYDYDKDPMPKSKRAEKEFAGLGRRTGADAHFYSRYFPKDSQHPELAGGEWLTKEEVRRIKEECDKRHIEIIPEMQSLSHSYYLCVSHPEIAERNDDPWPDHYCPSNPKTYELLFDVMDEAIEAFKPRIMHIGHDETYIYGVCPKCRDRAGHDIIAGDLWKIRDFLVSRGVRPLMWCCKLMPVFNNGLERTETDSLGRSWHMPAGLRAVAMAPTDIIMHDYKYGFPDSESYFNSYGYEVIYGNFLGNWQLGGFPEWERRSDRPYVFGAAISTWCEVSAYAFGHNFTPYKVFKAADMLWGGKQMDDEPLHALMVPHLARKLDEMSGNERWLVSGGKGKLTPVNIASASRALPRALAGTMQTGKKLQTVLGIGNFPVQIGEDGALQRAIVLDQKHPESKAVRVNKMAKKLMLVHGATMEGVYHSATWGSLNRGPGEVLRCEVTYADGKQESFSAYFGDDIGPVAGAWPTSAWMAGYERMGRTGYCHRSLPVPAGKEHTFFAQEWTNPRPEVEISSITFSTGADATDRGEVIVAAVSALESENPSKR